MFLCSSKFSLVGLRFVSLSLSLSLSFSLSWHKVHFRVQNFLTAPTDRASDGSRVVVKFPLKRRRRKREIGFRTRREREREQTNKMIQHKINSNSGRAVCALEGGRVIFRGRGKQKLQLKEKERERESGVHS